MQMNVCYKVTCMKCEEAVENEGASDEQGQAPARQGEEGRNQIGVEAVRRGGARRAPLRRSVYVGQTGRSIHSRMREHLKGLENRSPSSQMYKHWEEQHKNQQQPEFRMEKIISHRGNLPRLFQDGLLIERRENKDPNSLMNIKGEYARNKMVRFQPDVRPI